MLWLLIHVQLLLLKSGSWIAAGRAGTAVHGLVNGTACITSASGSRVARIMFIIIIIVINNIIMSIIMLLLSLLLCSLSSVSLSWIGATSADHAE